MQSENKDNESNLQTSLHPYWYLFSFGSANNDNEEKAHEKLCICMCILKWLEEEGKEGGASSEEPTLAPASCSRYSNVKNALLPQLLFFYHYILNVKEAIWVFCVSAGFFLLICTFNELIVQSRCQSLTLPPPRSNKSFYFSVRKYSNYEFAVCVNVSTVEGSVW